MHDEGFIDIGSTKMVNIDFSMSFPQTGYFIGVNVLFEFTSTGEVVPTKLEILPYKISSFSPFNSDGNFYIDSLKFLLVIYTAYCIHSNFKRSKKACTFINFSENFVDILIVLIQFYCALIKLQDGLCFDIDP